MNGTYIIISAGLVALHCLNTSQGTQLSLIALQVLFLNLASNPFLVKLKFLTMFFNHAVTVYIPSMFLSVSNGRTPCISLELFV